MTVMTCMAVIAEGPRIVFAAYQEESNRIVMEECYATGYEVEGVVENVKATARPTLLLLPVKVMGNPHLLDVLTQPSKQWSTRAVKPTSFSPSHRKAIGR